ncbi:MAG: hypothetical protein MUO82_00410 [Candidatus Thermoplasmatota archaeon]|nr:hypothetical protein [Candidatus Thermoplasmatota archaeon]
MVSNKSEINHGKLKNKIIKVARLDDYWMTPWSDGAFNRLEKCEWTVNNTIYKFKVTGISNNDIEKGNLKKYNVLIIGGTDQFANLGLWKIYNPKRYNTWTKNVKDFIKNGGGYIGHCAGTFCMCKLNDKPKSFIEKLINEASLNITDTKVSTRTALPLLNQLIKGRSPEDLGNAVYVIYSGLNDENPTHEQIGGGPIKFVINKDINHPIIKGYNKENIEINWAGGPGLIPGKKAKTILFYPKEKICELFPVKQWEYIGIGNGGQIGKWGGLAISVLQQFNNDTKLRGILSKSLQDLIKGKISDEELMKSIYENAKNDDEARDVMRKLYKGLAKATDWKRLSENFNIDLHEMSVMVTETYGDGRISLFGAHPEHKIWKGGKIVEENETKNNCLWDSLHRWVDYEYYEDDEGESRPYYWFLCREVAWAAGLNEDELPPVSQEKITICKT